MLFGRHTDVFPNPGDIGGIDSGTRSTDQHAAASQPRQAQLVLRPGLQGRLQCVDLLPARPNMRGLLLAVQGAGNPSQLQVSIVGHLPNWLVLVGNTTCTLGRGDVRYTVKVIDVLTSKIAMPVAAQRVYMYFRTLVVNVSDTSLMFHSSKRRPPP